VVLSLKADVERLGRTAKKPRQIWFLHSFDEAVEIVSKGFDRVLARTYMSGPARRGDSAKCRLFFDKLIL
jgi:hypothetical protein